MEKESLLYVLATAIITLVVTNLAQNYLVREFSNLDPFALSLITTSIAVIVVFYLRKWLK